MADRPKSITYKWTMKDQLVAQGDVSAGKYVTPYRILPQSVEGARGHASGAMVPIVLARSGEPWAVNRFFPSDKDFAWEKIPDEVTGYSTIAELCAKLFAHNPNRYVAAHYDFSKKSETARNEIALLLFDHWGNTEYRYAVTSSEGFSWSSLTKGAPALPAEKDGKKLLYVLAKKPVVIPVSAAPGVQSLRPADPGLELITADIFAISSRAQRIKHLLAKSEEVMKRRIMLATGMSALKFLFQASTTSKTGATLEAAVLAAKAAALDPIIKDAMQKSVPELLPKGVDEVVSRKTAAALREQLGYTDDIGAEVRRLSDELRDLLLDDKELADRCAAWGRYAIANKLQSTPAFESKCGRLVAAVTDALEMLAETQHGDPLADRLWKILDGRPKSAAREVADIAPGLASGLATLFAIVGNGSKASLTFIGNLAGPPSLSIAAIQAAASWSLVNAAASAATGDKSGFDKIAGRIFDALEPMLDPKKDVYAKLQAARAAKDEAALFDLRHAFAEEIGSNFQSSPRWKSGIVLLQILGFALAISNVVESGKKNTALVLYDYFDVGVQGASFIAGAAEVVTKAIGSFEKAEPVLKAIGLTIGRLSAVLGIISGFLELDNATREQQSRTLRQIAAMTTMFGNFFLLMGILPYLAPVPILQYAGLIPVAVGILITIAIQLSDPNPLFVPLGTNLVACSVFAAMKTNPFYDLLEADPALAPKLKEIEVGCRRGILPYAENTTLIIDMLARAGFTKKERAMIVNTDAPPPVLSFEKMLLQGI